MTYDRRLTNKYYRCYSDNILSVKYTTIGNSDVSMALCSDCKEKARTENLEKNYSDPNVCDICGDELR
jgi:hypothetical protein